MKKRHVYKITPEYKKAIYQEEHWINTLKNGKRVILHATTFFRWGTFEINLTEQEKKKYLKKIILYLMTTIRLLKKCGMDVIFM